MSVVGNRMVAMRVRLASVLCVAWAVLLCSTSAVCPDQTGMPPGLLVYSKKVDSRGDSPYAWTYGQYDLFCINSTTREATQVTDHRGCPALNLGGAIRDPSISPDGRMVVFGSNRADLQDVLITMITTNDQVGIDLWLLDISDKKVRQLTKDAAGYQKAVWSPDGKFFAVESSEGLRRCGGGSPTANNIYVWDVALGKRALVAKNAFHPVWFADRRRLMFRLADKRNLYWAWRSGGKPRLLVAGKENVTEYAPSPGGSRLAFYDGNDIYVADADGQNRRKLLEPKLRAYRFGPDTVDTAPLRWSRDGTKLAFTLYKRMPVPKDTYPPYSFDTELHVVDVGTKKDRLVKTFTKDVEAHVEAVAWTRDARYVIVTQGDPLREGLAAVRVDDGSVSVIKAANEPTMGLDWVSR